MLMGFRINKNKLAVKSFRQWQLHQAHMQNISDILQREVLGELIGFLNLEHDLDP